MSPSLSLDDPANGGFAEIEFDAQSSGGPMSFHINTSDFTHMRLRDFGLPAIFSDQPVSRIANFAPSPMPTFGVHIRDVILLRSKEKVIRVDARRIVAVMQDLKAFRNGTIVEFPRNPMDASLPIASPAKSDVSIAQTSKTAGPEPTAAIQVWLNEFPEPDSEWYRAPSHKPLH